MKSLVLNYTVAAQDCGSKRARFWYLGFGLPCNGLWLDVPGFDAYLTWFRETVDAFGLHSRRIAVG